MRVLFLTGIAAAALTLAACDSGNVSISSSNDGGKALVAATRLTCPEREGRLRLVSAGADGRSCFYRSRRGATVELTLRPVDGEPTAVLAALQDELAPLVPGAMTQAQAAAEAQAAAAEAQAEAAEAVAEAQAAAAEAQAVAAEARAEADEEHVRVGGLVDIRTKGDDATIRLPGVSIDAKGDDARIRAPGVSIDAKGDTARIRHVDKHGEQVTVDAREDGAVIRAESADGVNVRSTFMTLSDNPGPKGHRLAGYVVRGPRTGPLVVGVFRATDKRDRRIFDDVKDLVRRSAG